jgi:hypothetical protein
MRAKAVDPAVTGAGREHQPAGRSAMTAGASIRRPPCACSSFPPAPTARRS